jgi:hypothetical protein
MGAKTWEFPYYKYTLGRRKAVVDVTASIPAFDVEIDGNLRISWTNAIEKRRRRMNRDHIVAGGV